MKRRWRILAGVIAGAALTVGGIAVSQVVAHGNDSGLIPPANAVPLVTVPGSPGQPTWQAVSYENDGSLCFDVQGLTDGLVRGSVGGCGITESVALSLITAATEAHGAGPLPEWAKALPADPATLVNGWLNVADTEGQEHLYGIAAGTVPCECSVTVSWDDGFTASGDATGGIFVVARQYDDSLLATPASPNPESPHSFPPGVSSVTVDLP